MWRFSDGTTLDGDQVSGSSRFARAVRRAVRRLREPLPELTIDDRGYFFPSHLIALAREHGVEILEAPEGIDPFREP